MEKKKGRPAKSKEEKEKIFPTKTKYIILNMVMAFAMTMFFSCQNNFKQVQKIGVLKLIMSHIRLPWINLGLIFFLSLTSLFIACKDPDTADEPRLLLGRWQGACLQDYESFYTQRSVIFETNRKLRHKRVIYPNEACSAENALAQVEHKGRYDYAVTFKAFVYKLDMWIDASSVAVLEASLVERLNQTNACGFDGWQLGKSYQLQLLDESCPADVWAASFRSTFIKLESNELLFASLFDAKVADMVSLEDSELRYRFNRLD